MWLISPMDPISRFAAAWEGLTWESILEDDFLVGRFARCVTWNGKPLPSRSWRHASKKAFFRSLPAGVTFALLTESPGMAKWLASLPEYLANPSRRPGDRRARTTSDGSGGMSSRSSTTCGRCGSSSRTCGACSPARAGNLSRSSSGTWRPEASTSRRMYSAPRTWGRPTCGNGCSCSPSDGVCQTPSASAGFRWRRQVRQSERAEALLPAQAEDVWPGRWSTMTASDSSPKKQSNNDGADRTERLSIQVVNWTTPTVSDTFTDRLRSTQQKPGSRHSVNLGQEAAGRWPTATARAGDPRGGPSTKVAEERWRSGRRNPDDAVSRWPTATSTDSAGSRNATSGRRKGSRHHPGTTLTDAMERVPTGSAWPTPSARDPKGADLPGRKGSSSLAPTCEGVWPSPRANENHQGARTADAARDGSAWKGANRGATTTTKASVFPSGSSLRDRETLISVLGRLFSQPDPTLPRPSPRRLNPAFVEGLMGLPYGWSMLRCRTAPTGSGPSATPSSPRSRPSRTSSSGCGSVESWETRSLDLVMEALDSFRAERGGW